MDTIRVSVPWSYWHDAIWNRELHLTGIDPAHTKIGQALESSGWGSKRIVVDLTQDDIQELIEHCSFYSQGHYDADFERPFKYFGNKLKEKLTTIRKDAA